MANRKLKSLGIILAALTFCALSSCRPTATQAASGLDNGTVGSILT